MSITDELREWVTDHYSGWKSKQAEGIAIADRIDAEHEALRDQLDTSERQKESYREDLLAANRQVHASYNDGFDDGFASADDWLGQHEDAMAEHGWVLLPKDADNVPWSVGDHDEDGNEVIALKLASDGWYVITDGEWPYISKRKRHYHAPTVEDVLREFAYGLGVPVADSYVAATAAKLRLAEGEDA